MPAAGWRLVGGWLVVGAHHCLQDKSTAPPPCTTHDHSCYSLLLLPLYCCYYCYCYFLHMLLTLLLLLLPAHTSLVRPQVQYPMLLLLLLPAHIAKASSSHLSAPLPSPTATASTLFSTHRYSFYTVLYPSPLLLLLHDIILAPSLGDAMCPHLFISAGNTSDATP